MSHSTVALSRIVAKPRREGSTRRLCRFRPGRPEVFESRVVPTLIPPISIPPQPAAAMLYPYQVAQGSPTPYPATANVLVGARTLVDGRYFETFTNIGKAPITVGEASYTIFDPWAALATQEYLGSQTITLKPGQSGTVSAPESPCAGTQTDSYVGSPITSFSGPNDFYLGRLLYAPGPYGFNPGMPMPDGATALATNFNATPIAGGSYINFNAVLNVQGLSATKTTTIRFFGASVQLGAGGPTSATPSAVVTFSPAATKAQTYFDAGSKAWFTTVPSSGLTGNTYLDDFALPVPAAGLPGGIKGVTWSGQFYSDQPGVTIKWKFAAAVYKSTFATTVGGVVPAASYNALGIKPVDDSHVPLLDSHGNALPNNADRAGTPEEAKGSLGAGGATGVGGTDYTGAYSGTACVAPCVIPPEVPTGPIGSGDTATIGFWHNKNGQALILALNGGPNATALATYLTTAYPNLFPKALIGTTNASVAAYYLTLFNQTGPKLAAQIMDTALSTYVTNSTLAGTVAASYGFNVSPTGTATRTFVDTSGGAALLGLTEGTAYTIADYLNAANANAVNGVVLTGGVGTVESLFNAINSKGDIK